MSTYVSFHSHSSARIICFSGLSEFLANLGEVRCLGLLSFSFYFLFFIVKNHSIQDSVTTVMHIMS